MSNPGPAVTNSTHPQNLGTNQALRLIASQKGVSLAATGDTQLPIINSTTYLPVSTVVANANNAGAAISSPASVYLGVYTSPAGLGNAIYTSATMTSSFTSTTYATTTTSATATLAETSQYLYVNVATATVAGTVDVYVYGYDLS